MQTQSDEKRGVALLRRTAFLCILDSYVCLPAQDREHLSLLSVLYVCVFWRGEAEHLERIQLKASEPTARDRWQVGFLL